MADVLPIRKPDSLRRLIHQMAARTSGTLNISALANDLSIQRVTVEQYLDILVKLSVVIRLGHWTSGEGSRDIKNAKYHFVDSGVACALRRFRADTFDIASNPVALGGLLESFVFNELVRCLPFQDQESMLYHWRNRDRREIDVIVDAESRLVCIDVKAAAVVKAEDFRHIKWFSSEGPGRIRAVTGIIFFLGDQSLSFGENCFALPLSMMWTSY